MDREALHQKADELVAKLYGEGSPVSDEEIETLIRGLKRERYGFAHDLAKAVALTGLSVEELTQELSVEFRGHTINNLRADAPETGSLYLEKLNWACETLREKGYGDRLSELLHQPIIEGILTENPKISIFEAIRNNQDPMRSLVFLKPAGES